MREGMTDKVRIAHVLDAIREVETYLDGVFYDDFLANSEKRYATIKQIEIIGEACARISDVFKLEHPDMVSEIFPYMNTSVLTFRSYGKLPRMTCPL